MGLVTVRVYAVDENTDALDGVMVQVYDDTDAFVTQNVTSIVGAEAYAEFTINGDNPPVNYTIRLSKVGVAFDGLLGDDSQTPQAIQVYDPPAAAPVTGTNNFQVQAQTFTRPASTNPRLCRASGFFKDAAGRPRPTLDIKFIPEFDPLIVDGDAVMGYQVEGCTDENGYFEVELYRNGTYQAVLEALDDIPRNVVVPDLSSVNLIHLLFPVVESIVFDPDPASVTVDNTVDIDVTITTTAGVVLDPTDGDVIFSTDDAEIATAQLTTDGVLRIMGRSPGATTISTTRADTSIVIIPDVATASLAVTVT
jgi:hypothetical protein